MNDLISRQAAIDAIMGQPPEPHYPSWYAEQIKKLPSAQPDLEEYSVWFRIGETLADVSKMHITAEEGIKKIRSYLMRMKKPERKKGRWKRLIVPCNPDKGGFTQTKYECSECGEEATISWLNMYDLSDFCPNCGADMRGEQDG